MNYNDKVQELTQNFQHPCDAEVPAGYYRRVMFEKYNKDGSNKRPAIQEEWDTEVIPIGKRVFIKNPFGLKSDPVPVQTTTDPNTGAVTNPKDTCAGVWSDKIGYCFSSQKALEDYVKSIGSTLQSDNNWYGADLSKSNLFKDKNELSMYKLENTGAIWKTSGYKVDARTCMRYDDATGAATLIDFNGTGTSRSAYLKHYEGDHPCTYVGMRVNSDADITVPGKPESVKVDVTGLPLVYSAICLPVAFGFPYNNISQSILAAWNKTRAEFKVTFDGLSGLVQGTGDRIATMYDNLSVSMEELGQSALAFSQQALQLAWMEFQKIISTAMNIVGGGWDLIKQFLPAITIMGISVDIIDLCTKPGSLQTLVNAAKGKEQEFIDSVYAVIGSSYKYAIEYVKMTARDIVDAATDFYDWCWSQLQYAGVALCKLLGELAQIWSIPPEVPNPIWLAIKAVRELFGQIEPLDIIMSGNFPGFTSSDLYATVMEYVNKQREAVLAQVEALKQQLKEEYQNLVKLKEELAKEYRYYRQYLAGMWEQVKEETTKAKEAVIKFYEDKIKSSESSIKDKEEKRKSLLDSIKDVLKIGMEYLKTLPIMSTVNELLDLAGASIDSIVTMYENAETKVMSLYENFIDGSRSLKDICKTIYNQCCTLALSKVTQWVNKLLHILTLVIEYPLMNFCAPLFKY